MNKILRASVVLVLLLTACGKSAGQTIDDIGQWNALFAQDHFTSDSPLRWWFDGHYRLFEDNDGFGQSIIRPGLGIDIGENSALWAGYAWIHTSPITGDELDEHRIWQQWTSSRKAGHWKLAVRTRFEQRFFESTDDTGLRLRQFLRADKNLGACSKRTFVVWDEFFVGLNDTDFGQRSGFDQNRFFVGFGFKNHHSSPWIAEVGYMNQAINQGGPIDRSNHILAVNIFRSPQK
jgi:Protein of unknown function (DUF2490)